MKDWDYSVSSEWDSSRVMQRCGITEFKYCGRCIMIVEPRGPGSTGIAKSSSRSFSLKPRVGALGMGAGVYMIGVST